MPNQILITGAASGIGKAFVKAYLALPNNYIYVVDIAFKARLCAGSAASEELQAVYRKEVSEDHSSENSRIVSFKGCDLTSEEDIENEFSDGPTELDLVIHSAGIRGLVPGVDIIESADVANAETMQIMDPQTLCHAFNVNVVGSFLFLRTVAPRVRQGKGKIVVMGSRMGSIASNITGGAFAYRASKAALNMVVKSFSIDMPGVIFMTVHPGRVETKLVRVKEDGAMPVEESVKEMVDLIEKVERKDSGRFTDRFGDDIPW